MLLLSRLRFALARRPWLYWLFFACCVAFVWLVLAAQHAELAEQRRRWGETRRVWVADSDVAQGDVVRSVARDYPIAMVPASAIYDEPIGVTASASIADGEVLVDTDVAAATQDVASDWVVFALAVDDAPTMHPGSTVAVFGGGQHWCDGTVVAVGDDVVEVAVPSTCATEVSLQVASGSIVLATKPS